MKPDSIANIIRPIYLYLVCVVTVVVFIIGTVTICNVLIRQYVFGVSTSWYQSPYEECRRTAYNPDRGDVVNTELDSEAEYEKCVTRMKKETAIRAKYDLADKFSTGISMIFVSTPLFLFHWNLAKNEGKETGRKRRRKKKRNS